MYHLGTREFFYSLYQIDVWRGIDFLCQFLFVVILGAFIGTGIKWVRKEIWPAFVADPKTHLKKWWNELHYVLDHHILHQDFSAQWKFSKKIGRAIWNLIANEPMYDCNDISSDEPNDEDIDEDSIFSTETPPEEKQEPVSSPPPPSLQSSQNSRGICEQCEQSEPSEPSERKSPVHKKDQPNVEQQQQRESPQNEPELPPKEQEPPLEEQPKTESQPQQEPIEIPENIQLPPIDTWDDHEDDISTVQDEPIDENYYKSKHISPHSDDEPSTVVSSAESD
jgi:hypothetical protein